MNNTLKLSKTSVRSLLIFTISFSLLVLYFCISKPLYVKEKDTKEISFRLLILYSLLFSSGLSLIIMTIDVLYHYYLK